MKKINYKLFLELLSEFSAQKLTRFIEKSQFYFSNVELHIPIAKGAITSGNAVLSWVIDALSQKVKSPHQRWPIVAMATASRRVVRIGRRAFVKFTIFVAWACQSSAFKPNMIDAFIVPSGIPTVVNGLLKALPNAMSNPRVFSAGTFVNGIGRRENKRWR